MDESLYAMSLFWVCKSVGRGLVIPLSYLMSTVKQLYFLVIGCLCVLSTCVVLNIFGLPVVSLYFGSAGAGAFMSGIYPLTITLPGSIGLAITSQHTAEYMLGSCIGFGATPYLVGVLMSQFGPDMLFVSEAATASLMLLLLILVVRIGTHLQTKQSNQLQQ